MPVIKYVLAIMISLLPASRLRIWAYRLLFGYHIVNSRLGFGTVIVVDRFRMEGGRLGLFNLIGGPMQVSIGPGSAIGNRNTFACGYWVLREAYGATRYTRRLEIGKEALITSNHYFDVAGTLRLGERSWIAGLGSQFWTHGAGVRDRDIFIGEDCYIASAVRFAPGACIGNQVLVAMGSVVTGEISGERLLVGGVPARILKTDYDWRLIDERETAQDLSN